VRGFGPVKQESHARAEPVRRALRKRLADHRQPEQHARTPESETTHA